MRCRLCTAAAGLESALAPHDWPDFGLNARNDTLAITGWADSTRAKLVPGHCVCSRRPNTRTMPAAWGLPRSLHPDAALPGTPETFVLECLERAQMTLSLEERRINPLRVTSRDFEQ